MSIYWIAALTSAIYWIWKLVSVVAGRLDVLHRRKDLMRDSLEIQLAWREHIFTELLQNGVIPISQQSQAARVLLALENSTENGDSEYFAAESDFSSLLIDIFESPDSLTNLLSNRATKQELVELAKACRRVALARRFHNDAVGALLLLRVRASVRWFKLAGNTPWPRPIDLADSVPGSLENLR